VTASGAPDLSSLPVPVGLVTYSVKPRGGVVHTLALAEALHAAGYPVRVIALGDPAAGFFRPVQAPSTIIQAPASLPTLEERVFANVDALAGGLAGLAGEYPILHTQDCISARAACRVRAIPGAARPPVVIRTVHHVDDFTSPSLIDCQRQAILEPDRVLVVSTHWQEILADEYGTAAEVVHNGVDSARFQASDPALATALRQRAGAAGRPLILAVGGIEPRKGSDTLVQAIAALRRSGRNPVLAIVGGHSFQDYREYRERVLSSLPQLNLLLGDDVVLLGTVADAELPGWYAAADVLAFPSTKEGWGLAVLEAMSAGLPVVASDLPVFREYLRPGRDALMVPVNDAVALAAALTTVLDDRRLADRLRSAGRALCTRFTWARSAAEHQKIYAGAGSRPRSSHPVPG
jgi:glycosyltransferase-like protein